MDEGTLYSLASNAAVLLVLFYASWLRPVRLPANSQNIFWLVLGVNTAGLLLPGLSSFGTSMGGQFLSC